MMRYKGAKEDSTQIRVGVVSSVDLDQHTVRVLFPDLDNQVSSNLEVLRDGMPNIDETVVCIFLGNGLESGFCLGSPYKGGTQS